MQMFRSLVGDDTDADQLLGLALGVATRRVVVKRPVHAPFLAQKKPTHSFVGKTARFDMYLVSAQPDQGS
jgi:16S rRNA (guanine1516-N2)-methyltransferase